MKNDRHLINCPHEPAAYLSAAVHDRMTGIPNSRGFRRNHEAARAPVSFTSEIRQHLRNRRLSETVPIVQNHRALNHHSPLLPLAALKPRKTFLKEVHPLREHDDRSRAHAFSPQLSLARVKGSYREA